MAVLIVRIYVCVRCGGENTKARPRKGMVEIVCRDCGQVAECLPPTDI